MSFFGTFSLRTLTILSFFYWFWVNLWLLGLEFNWVFLFLSACGGNFELFWYAYIIPSQDDHHVEFFLLVLIEFMAFGFWIQFGFLSFECLCWKFEIFCSAFGLSWIFFNGWCMCCVIEEKMKPGFGMFRLNSWNFVDSF